MAAEMHLATGMTSAQRLLKAANSMDRGDAHIERSM
jgi:hypothetical protein